MSTTNSRPKRPKNDLHQPLDPKHLERGRTLAARYQAVIWLENGEYYGRGLELPWTFEDGKTADECFAKLRDAMAETVAFMLDNGQNPPAPVGEARRTAQVNIRITTQEKSLLEQVARSHGYHGVSDYVRDRVLSAG